MPSNPGLDGVIVQWGDRLFYPANRMVRSSTPKLTARALQERAAALRSRIRATVVRRAPQVMVKVTGGGRGMQAIVAHFRYISKNGRLAIEDEHGEQTRGRETVRELADDWRLGGTRIDDVGDRREAFNIMLSMPRGVDASTVQRAAREFARQELADHKYVMVLHDHQANPHVHLSVRAESKHGKRLNPRKEDLHRWRDTFAQKLRGWGIDAEATRQATRGIRGKDEPLWRIKAQKDGRLAKPKARIENSRTMTNDRIQALEAWARLAEALSASPDPSDRTLGAAVGVFVRSMTAPRDMLSEPIRSGPSREPGRAPEGPDVLR